ncbi:MAG: NADH-quinone oxidoreductase subunit D [Ardenticatenales bacterium]|nr:NADH-quinone oxidoreductase subunit D [Ardenticatenales bacterium]
MTKQTDVVAAPAPADVVAAVHKQLGERVTVDDGGALVVGPSNLIDVVRALRDDHGLDYLANLTAVDWLDRFEVVYHLCSSAGGAPIVLKTTTDRANPRVPSLFGIYPGADFQEREVYDMFGIRFAGHPNLKRILMWEGFAGWPLRKDWREAYFEQEHKPLTSRWPDGQFFFGEDKLTDWGSNTKLPPAYTGAEIGRPKPQEGQYVVDIDALRRGTSFGSDRLVVNMGPQHPSTHGVFQMRLVLDGETVVDLEPVMGYMHRNHEKIGERNLWLGNMPFTDRLDYIAQLGSEWGYALCVERMMGLEVPERAEYIRVIMAELNRIQSHFWSIGFLLNDLGAFFTPSLYAIEEREIVLDLFEMATGSRLMCNYMRFGGVAYDLPDAFMPLVNVLVNERMERAIDEIDAYLTNNEIVMERMKGVGVLTPELAIAYSTSGPVLRGSGVAYDVRRADPYGIYDRFDWNVVTANEGDVYARYAVRIGEMRESLKILRQALPQMPAGEILGGKKAWQVRVPAGEHYARVENPRGELGYYCVSDGKANPYRYHVRSPCFVNLTSLAEMCKGYKVADVVAILGSIDIVLGEVDR